MTDEDAEAEGPEGNGGCDKMDENLKRSAGKDIKKRILFASMVLMVFLFSGFAPAAEEDYISFGEPTVEYDAYGCPVSLGFPITNPWEPVTGVVAYLYPDDYWDNVCVTDNKVTYGNLQQGETETPSDRFDLRVCAPRYVDFKRNVYYDYGGETYNQYDTITVDASSCTRECPEPEFEVRGVEVLSYSSSNSPETFKVSLRNVGGGPAYNTKAHLAPQTEDVTVTQGFSRCPDGEGTVINPGDTQACGTPYQISAATTQNPIRFKLNVEWTNCHDEQESSRGTETLYLNLPNTGRANLKIRNFQITPLW